MLISLSLALFSLLTLLHSRTPPPGIYLHHPSQKLEMRPSINARQGKGASRGMANADTGHDAFEGGTLCRVGRGRSFLFGQGRCGVMGDEAGAVCCVVLIC
jgi:hypothetical protein